MVEIFVNSTKNDQGNGDSCVRLRKDCGLVEDSGSKFTELKTKGSLRGQETKKLTSDTKQTCIDGIRMQESFFQTQHVTDVRKLKYLNFGSLNEKHLLQHYLDLVKVRPSDSLAITYSPSSPCDIAVKLRSSKRDLFDHLNPIKNRRRNTCDLGSFMIDRSSATGQGNLVVSPAGQLIARNDNMRSILKSPLTCHLGALDDGKKSEKTRSTEIQGEKLSPIMSSPEGLIVSASLKPEKESPLEKLRNGQEKLHKRLFSVSSTNSSSSDQSSSSACAPVSQGMLHCKWKGGIPYFVFSVDDQREVYTANLWKLGSANDKGLDYMYSFHSQTCGQKEQGGSDNLDHVGKMKVSSSFILCPNRSKLMETEFVLFGTNEHHPSEMQSLASTAKKNWRLSKKVVDAFRTSHASKYKPRPKGVPSSISEDHSGEQFLEMLGEPDALDFTLLQSNLSPNLELAAIVVREYVHDTCQEASVGGWGLKFLEKARAEQANGPVEDFDSLENSQESSLRNRNDCSTSMDVLIPAGFHGGPRTINGGPSSLTMRWRSGGHCDCGGWDIGCPLTVLHNMPSREVLLRPDAEGECKSFDLFMQGSKQGEPTLRMVNIQDSLYFIHFQSSLTALQAFSVGVAIIHNQSSALCPKDVTKLKQEEPRTTIL